MSKPRTLACQTTDQIGAVDDLFISARKAQKTFEKNAIQADYDRAALAAAWALMQPERNTELVLHFSQRPLSHNW